MSVLNTNYVHRVVIRASNITIPPQLSHLQALHYVHRLVFDVAGQQTYRVTSVKPVD